MSDKPRCPEAIRKAYHETDTCAIQGEMCLLESNTPREIYEEYLLSAKVEERE